MASTRPILGIGQPDGAMAMILNDTKTGVTVDWEDMESLKKFILDCWNRHLKGELKTEDSDISRFTRRNLTRRMAQLFDKITKNE